MTRTDVVISSEGPLFLFYLLSPAAEQWVELNASGETASRVPSPNLRAIDLKDGAEQDVSPLCTLIPTGQFARRVADAADARHEDHAHR